MLKAFIDSKLARRNAVYTPPQNVVPEGPPVDPAQKGSTRVMLRMRMTREDYPTDRQPWRSWKLYRRVQYRTVSG